MEVKEHKNLNQAFREKLQDHEVAPPAHIWEGIQASGLSNTAARSNSWRWWAAAGILALILSGASYIYLSSDSSETEKSLSKQNIEIVDSQLNESTLPTSSEINDISEEAEQEMVQEIIENTDVEEQIIPESLEEQEIQAPIAINITDEDNDYGTEDILEEVENNTEVFIQDEEASITEEEVIVEVIKEEQENRPIFDSEAINATSNNAENLNSEISLVEIENNERASKAGYDYFDEDATKDIMQGHNDQKRWELGIEFSPEWISIPENDNNIKSYGLDLSARYHFSKWFVETGIGAALSKDDGIYKVDTVSKFKGSYWDVYEVTFDESTGEPTPIYHTQLKNVYENIDTNYVSRTENDYIYLNIPLNIGYSTRLSEKFAVYFKTGIINSFKIYENIPEFETAEGADNDLIHSEARYFERTPWHMQAQLNVGVNYYLTDKFMFGVEPNARYFIKSLVEDNNGGNPYGFGVKVGFKYVIKR